MNFQKDLSLFQPQTPEESAAKEETIHYLTRYGDAFYTRECSACHLTSSGFVVNRSLDKVLFVHHRIYGSWCWTGGHADGEHDLLKTAIRETQEETGVLQIKLLCETMVSLDKLSVPFHQKKGKLVLAHMHMNASYLLLCDESEKITPNLEENSAVQWIETKCLQEQCKEPYMLPVYEKLLNRARQLMDKGRIL